MDFEFIQWGGVFVCFTVLFVFPAVPLSIRLVGKGDWPEVVLGAIVLGFGSQTLLGLCWSHWVGGRPMVEAVVFTVIWGLLFLSGGTIWYLRTSRQGTPSKQGGRSHLLFIAILAAAILIRSIHPLQTAALGQSDAYAHLHFLRDIVEQGRLHVVVYPPGYHWLLALPVLIFGIDPYIVVRFAGAFFGTAMVLAVYVLLLKLFDRRSALFGSFCAGCFPGMTLLMKTGVGSFANQLGLFLIPCLILYYAGLVDEKNRRGNTVLFLTAITGMAASVPMMLIHVLIVIGIERCTALVMKRQKWFAQSTQIACFCLIAAMVVLFHYSQAGPGQKRRTASVLIEYSSTIEATTKKVDGNIERLTSPIPAFPAGTVKSLLKHPYFSLIIDYFSIKRSGFQNRFIDGMAVTLFVLFLVCFGHGLRTGKTGFILLGIWGVLTSVQAATGFLQFSAYQREGWSLLVATAMITGVCCSLIFGVVSHIDAARYAAGMVIIGLAFWSFRHPPVHQPAIGNEAESLIIRVVRSVSGDREVLVEKCRNKKTPECRLSGFLDRDVPLVIVTRHLTGWSGNGMLVPNVLPLNSRVASLEVNKVSGVPDFKAGRQYLVLIDTKPPSRRWGDGGAFYMVSPKMVEGLIKKQIDSYRSNAIIREYVKRLDRTRWRMDEVRLSGSLDGIIVRPAT